MAIYAIVVRNVLKKHRFRTTIAHFYGKTSKLLLVNDIASFINGTPMHDVADFGGDAHSTLSDFPAVRLIGNGIALAINLSQGVIHCVIHLQFEDEDVVLGLYHHVGTTEDALHLSINY